MAVAANNKHAGFQVPALGQHHMADAFAVMKGDLPLPGPLARQLENARALIGITRHEMIRNQHHLGGVEQPDAEFLEDRLDPARPARIVDHRKIDPSRDHFARTDSFRSGSTCNDLLRKRRCHHASPR